MAETTLPLGTNVTYRGMTGTDEDLLSNNAKVRSGQAINQILANCTSRLALPGKDAKTNISENDFSRLKSPERSALLLAIRRESYGDDVLIDLQCAACREKFAITFDLAQLKVKPARKAADGTIDPGPYTLTLTLPGVQPAKSGLTGVEAEDDSAPRVREVVVDFLDGRREVELAKTKENIASMAMLVRIKSVEGVHQNRVFEWLQNLPVASRSALRKEMATTECGIEEEQTADCPSCGEEVAFNALQQPRFFFPQG